MTERKIEETNSDRMVQKTQAPVQQPEKPGAKQQGNNPYQRISASDAPSDPDQSVNEGKADLNNPTQEPPEESKVKLRKNAEESSKLDSPQRTNDSTIDPNKPENEILRGFHGG